MVWELLALALFGWSTLRLLEQLTAVPPTAGWVLSGLLAAAWIAASWRIVRYGVYVNDYGLRIQGLLRSRVIAWPEVKQIAMRDTSHVLLGITVAGGPNVLIDLRTGETAATPLYANGIDFLFRPHAFGHAYRELRGALAAATAGPSTSLATGTASA